MKVSDQVKELEAERDVLKRQRDAAEAELLKLKAPKYTAYYVGGPYDLTKRQISKPEPVFVILVPHSSLGFTRYTEARSFMDYQPMTATYRLAGHLRGDALVYEYEGIR